MPATTIAESLPGLQHRDSMLRQIDHRTQDSFAYAREIRRSWGHLEPVLEWCKTSLRDDWRWQMIEMNNGLDAGRYIFYFDSDQDAMLFSLKWC